MKKMLMSIAFIFCLCCCMCGVNANILLANSFEVNNSVIEVTDGITHLSSIGDATYFKNKIYITDKTNNKIFELGNSTNIIYESQIVKVLIVLFYTNHAGVCELKRSLERRLAQGAILLFAVLAMLWLAGVKVYGKNRLVGKILNQCRLK